MVSLVLTAGIRMLVIAQRNGNTWSNTHEGAVYHNAQRIWGPQNPNNHKVCCKMLRHIQQQVLGSRTQHQTGTKILDTWG